MSLAGARGRGVFHALCTFELLALALWGGGLAVLGAVVAPVVFRIVPAPTNADAMTVVFRRFDTVAIGCALAALAAELVRGRLRLHRRSRLDLARSVSLLAALTLAALVGLWLSPAIADLHHMGAVRGAGESGQRLARLHTTAETLAKAESLFILTVFILCAASRARSFREESAELK